MAPFNRKVKTATGSSSTLSSDNNAPSTMQTMTPNANASVGSGGDNNSSAPETSAPITPGKKQSKIKRLLKSATRRTTSTTKKKDRNSSLVMTKKLPINLSSIDGSNRSDLGIASHNSNSNTETTTATNQQQQEQAQLKSAPRPTGPPPSLEEIAIRLQADIEIRNRNYHLKTYVKCFVGSELVDYLVENQLAPSRSEAVKMGQELMTTLEAFDHVAQDPEFKDGYLFYQFKKDDDFAEEETDPDYEKLSNTLGDRSVGSIGSSTSSDMGDKIIKMDKYGFLLDDDRCSANSNEDEPHSRGTSSSAGNLARLRASDAKRWENILVKGACANNNNGGNLSSSSKLHNNGVAGTGGANAGGSYAATQSKVKYYARRGLPDKLRQKAWTVLTGVDLIMTENTGEYDALVQKAEEEYRKIHDLESAADSSESCADGAVGGPRANAEGSSVPSKSTSQSSRVGSVLDTIERDIHRTFPKHYLFHTGPATDEEDETGSARSAGAESAYDSDAEEEESRSGSESGGDDIVETAESTGQDPKGVVEAKKQLFNESMDTLMTMGLRSVDGTGIARIGGQKKEDSVAPVKKDSRSASGPGSECGSLDLFDEEEEDEFNELPPGMKSDRGLGLGLGNRSISWKSTEALGMGRGQGALRRVLRAYSMYDAKVGYCQGMNFITAMFLTFLTEEEAFWLLVVVMNEEPYKLRELFGEDMAGTHEVLYIAEKLLAQFLPKLSKHMEAESIHVSMFVTQWLLTVYTSTFPFELVARVWDSFLVEGWKVVYRVMLSLLEFASKDILELRFEDILHYFREFPSKVNGPTIMAGSLKIALKRKHIQKHVNEWRRHAGDDEPRKHPHSSFYSIRRRASDETSSVSAATLNSLARVNALSKIASNPLKKQVKEIVVEDLSEPLLPIIGKMKFAVLLHNVVTPEECSELIDRAEENGFHDAYIYDRRTNEAHRNCIRYIVDDAKLADDWYERVLNALTGTPLEKKLMNAPWIDNNARAKLTGKEDERYRAVGLNERLRLLKYKQGEFFHSHNDAVFVRGPNEGERAGETSSVSMHVYLNQKFKGGLTTFHGQGRHMDVKPRTGSILIFEHDILHEGQTVTHGKKYVVRTDVMYSTAKAGLTSDASGLR